VNATDMPISEENLIQELLFATSRSSGAGGQNVNKVNSKVTLYFTPHLSRFLSEEQKEMLCKKLQSKLTKDGVLMLSSQQARTQLENKALVIDNFLKLINSALIKPKKRKPTKPTKGSVKERMESKKQQSEKKKWRKKPE
jgi:ribosome-associated protein